VSKPEPKRMTCAQLIKEGPGDNAHVVISDFLIPNSAFCYEGNKRGNSWKTVWVVALPADSDYARRMLDMHKAGTLSPDATMAPDPKEVRLLIKSSKVKDEAQLGALADQEEVEGLVVNKISSLGSKERRILEKSYGGVNFDNVYILEHDRSPATVAKSVGMMGGGGALAVVGVLGLFRRRS
jgi:hypothetical protein